jgi:xanthine/uracil permease
VLPGAVLFVVGVVATLGISWFDRRKDRSIKTWAVAVMVVSIPYGIAAWWVWSIDDDRAPVGVISSAGLLVGFIVAHFMFDKTAADRTDESPPSDSH